MMKKINTTYLIALSALVFASCSESNGLSSGIPLSKEKIAFAATLQDVWNGGTSAEAGNNSRAGKPTFSGLAMEQKVLTANEGLAKPLYLHPLETENTSVMNAMPQTRGVMNESSTVGSFGVSAVYSKDGVNYSPLFQNEEATQNGNYWFTSGNATWPLDGSVSFYAYAPYNDASLSLQGSDDFVKNKTIRYTANTDDLSKQPDLIVAKSESNAFTSSTANKAVGLSFRHALTAITFSISADMIPGKVKSITVSGVYGQGDYDFSNASWVSLASPSTYVIKPNDASVNAGESKALTDKNSALMMIPQKLGPDANVSMVFNDGAKDKTVSFSLNGTSWTAGKHITYVLSSSKITTLKMGDLTYPTAWNSVNDGATYKIRTAYDDPNSSVDAGLFVVNEKKEVIAANVQLTLSGTSWSLPKGSKLKFSPKYSYFVYYPYQANLAGLPAVNTPGSDVSSSTKFFADAIANWKIATDQSTPDKMNACDLQIGKGSLDEDGCSVSFKMEHAMGLAILNRESKSVPKHYILSGYPSYTWDNGTTTLIPSATLSNGQKLYATTNTQGVKVIPPSAAFPFSSTSKGDDAWNGDVNITAAANGVGTGTAKIKATMVDYTYTMEVGDIYYSDGAMTHQSEDLASDKTPIGIVGYLGSNYWTEKDTKEKGIGGHALVMCLKTIGSTGSTKAAQEDYKNNGDKGAKVKAYIGTGYAWYSLESDADRPNVNSKSLLVNSNNQPYGSGYTETDALIKKWNSDAAAAYYAQNYKTLPANSAKCTGWFLPTAGQYYAVMTNLGAPFSDDWTGIWDGNTSTHPNRGFFSNMTTVTTNINDKLKKVGDTKYTEFFGSVNTWAWTSSEFSSTNAVGIDSGINDYKDSGSVSFCYDITMTRSVPVRPFLAF